MKHSDRPQPASVNPLMALHEAASTDKAITPIADVNQPVEVCDNVWHIGGTDGTWSIAVWMDFGRFAIIEINGDEQKKYIVNRRGRCSCAAFGQPNSACKHVGIVRTIKRNQNAGYR